MEEILKVENLNIHFDNEMNQVKAVEGINLSVLPGQIHGIVGESGCGKSVTGRAIIRILNVRGSIPEGKILFKKNGDVIDLTKLPKHGEDMRKIRGNEIGMIFQEPMTAFSPVYTIGNQIMEAILLHQDKNKSEARKRAISILNRVGLPDASELVDEYPHQLSGGMRQRAMIAMALSCNPKLLIADEPTTALDVTIQAQILELLSELQASFGMAIIFITHDLGVIAEMADNVSVMYLGKIMENSNVKDLFHNPLHPYTKSLLKSIPEVDTAKKGLLEVIKGSVPDAAVKPTGCYFHPRCPEFIPGVCDVSSPEEIKLEDDHMVSCFIVEDEVENYA